MSSNTFGTLFKYTTWGESHGPAIGCVVDGCPPLLELSEADIQFHLDRRKPGQNRFMTQRQEEDKVKILSGVFEGKTTGAPISLLIENTDAKSKDYNDIKDKYRPGHADFTYDAKYGIRDYRGGGRSSARETACRVAAGAVARNILSSPSPVLTGEGRGEGRSLQERSGGAYPLPNPLPQERERGQGIIIRAGVIQIGPHKIDRAAWDWKAVDENAFFSPDREIIPVWEQFLDKTRKSGSSAGAIVEVVASGVPAGLGAPVADKLDAALACAMMGINAVKGVEIGAGFGAALLPGEVNADQIRIKNGKPHFLSNNAGGILGGISTGQDIVVRLAFKPTSSILTPMQTINNKGEETEIVTKGRHDPCVGIRGAPVAEAMMAVVLADHLLRQRGQCG